MDEARSSSLEPREDYGIFGPGSVTWRVWGYPTSLTVGFQRSVVVEELDPFLVASVYASQRIIRQARIRYDHTLRYFATIAFGGSREVVEASATLMRVHSRNVGVDPVSGLHFDPNNPDSQLWIHLTAWHSILYAYERYGPGRLSPEEEARYWEECATAAELQTCDPAKVPRTREGIRNYFEAMRPRLAASEATQEVMRHLLRAEVMLPPMPRIFRLGAWVNARVLRAATIATMPRWQRQLAGLRQPRIVDVLVRPVMRISFRVIASSGRLRVRALRLLSPSTVEVAGPMLLGIPPHDPTAFTPNEAFERAGTPAPAELYEELQGGPDLRVVHTPSAPAHSSAGLAAATASQPREDPAGAVAPL
jgi:uncharacterized protein (DUF2236 family)